MFRPGHLNRQNADAFLDADVAKLYRYRPEYPDDLIRFLSTLAVDQPRRVLDLGAGTGFLARPLAPLVGHVDAIDPSAAMLDEGRNQAGGDHTRIRWIEGNAETVELDGPYSLIVTGDALHWMDWPVVLSRCSALLTPNGYLAVTGVDELETPWRHELKHIIASFSVVKDYVPFNLVDALEQEGLFQRSGQYESQPYVFEQTVAEYIESFHARSSLARNRMGTSDAELFDLAVGELMSRYCSDRVTRSIKGIVTYGKPASGIT